MEKGANSAQGPLVPNDAGADPGAAQNVGADSSSESGKAHQFNEQTNYVPVRTIITVPTSPPFPAGRDSDRHRSFLHVQASICWL